MSKSKITLYQTRLSYNSNWQIDDIEDYLNTCKSLDIGEVRYTEPKLSQVIVIKKPQSNLVGLSYNYAKIKDDSFTWYAFVQSLDWGSKNSIKVTLALDTMNTVGYALIDHMTSQTSIIREHINRWTSNNIAIVDKYDEGISVAKTINTARSELVKSKIYHIQLSVNATTSNVSDTHPYKMLTALESKSLWSSGGTSTGTYTVGAGTNICYFLEGTITVGSDTYTIGSSTKAIDGQIGVLRAIAVNASQYKLIYCTGDIFPYSVLTTDIKDYVYPTTIKMSNCRRMYKETYNASTFANINNLDRIPFLTYTSINVGTYAAQYVNGIDDIDKTYSGIMQINPVPYYNYTNMTFIEGFNLLYTSSETSYNIYNGSLTSNKLDHTPSSDDEWNYKYESKLLHPSITDSQLCYQGNVLRSVDWSKATNNVGYTINLQFDDTNVSLMKFYIPFTYYNTSSFIENYAYITNKYNIPLFTNQWTEYVRNGYNYDAADVARQKDLQGWNIALGIAGAAVGIGSNALTVGKGIKSGIQKGKERVNKAFGEYLASQAYVDPSDITDLRYKYNRENDMFVITGKNRITNDYINDVSAGTWARELRRTVNGVVAAEALKSIEADKLGAMVLNQGINSINSVVSASNSIGSNNANYQQSISSKSQSHTTIIGNTNSYKLAVDNLITYEMWQPEQYILNNIAKVFHLTGYSHPVQEKPNTTSRQYFNYIQCMPMWDSVALNDCNPLWLADYSSRLEQGLTVFHKVNNSWDLDQAKENWEVSLIN